MGENTWENDPYKLAELVHKNNSKSSIRAVARYQYQQDGEMYEAIITGGVGVYRRKIGSKVWENDTGRLKDLIHKDYDIYIIRVIYQYQFQRKGRLYEVIATAGSKGHSGFFTRELGPVPGTRALPDEEKKMLEQEKDAIKTRLDRQKEELAELKQILQVREEIQQNEARIADIEKQLESNEVLAGTELVGGDDWEKSESHAPLSLIVGVEHNQNNINDVIFYDYVENGDKYEVIVTVGNEGEASVLRPNKKYGSWEKDTGNLLSCIHKVFGLFDIHRIASYRHGIGDSTYEVMIAVGEAGQFGLFRHKVGSNEWKRITIKLNELIKSTHKSNAIIDIGFYQYTSEGQTYEVMVTVGDSGTAGAYRRKFGSNKWESDTGNLAELMKAQCQPMKKIRNISFYRWNAEDNREYEVALVCNQSDLISGFIRAIGTNTWNIMGGSDLITLIREKFDLEINDIAFYTYAGEGFMHENIIAVGQGGKIVTAYRDKQGAATDVWQEHHSKLEDLIHNDFGERFICGITLHRFSKDNNPYEAAVVYGFPGKIEFYTRPLTYKEKPNLEKEKDKEKEKLEALVVESNKKLEKLVQVVGFRKKIREAENRIDNINDMLQTGLHTTYTEGWQDAEGFEELEQHIAESFGLKNYIHALSRYEYTEGADDFEVFVAMGEGSDVASFRRKKGTQKWEKDPGDLAGLIKKVHVSRWIKDAGFYTYAEGGDVYEVMVTVGQEGRVGVYRREDRTNIWKLHGLGFLKARIQDKHGDSNIKGIRFFETRAPDGVVYRSAVTFGEEGKWARIATRFDEDSWEWFSIGDELDTLVKEIGMTETIDGVLFFKNADTSGTHDAAVFIGKSDVSEPYSTGIFTLREKSGSFKWQRDTSNLGSLIEHVLQGGFLRDIQHVRYTEQGKTYDVVLLLQVGGKLHIIQKAVGTNIWEHVQDQPLIKGNMSGMIHYMVEEDEETYLMRVCGGEKGKVSFEKRKIISSENLPGEEESSLHEWRTVETDKTLKPLIEKAFPSYAVVSDIRIYEYSEGSDRYEAMVCVGQNGTVGVFSRNLGTGIWQEDTGNLKELISQAHLSFDINTIHVYTWSDNVKTYEVMITAGQSGRIGSYQREIGTNRWMEDPQKINELIRKTVKAEPGASKDITGFSSYLYSEGGQQSEVLVVVCSDAHAYSFRRRAGSNVWKKYSTKNLTEQIEKLWGGQLVRGILFYKSMNKSVVTLHAVVYGKGDLLTFALLPGNKNWIIQSSGLHTVLIQEFGDAEINDISFYYDYEDNKTHQIAIAVSKAGRTEMFRRVLNTDKWEYFRYKIRNLIGSNHRQSDISAVHYNRIHKGERVLYEVMATAGSDRKIGLYTKKGLETQASFKDDIREELEKEKDFLLEQINEYQQRLDKLTSGNKLFLRSFIPPIPMLFLGYPGLYIMIIAGILYLQARVWKACRLGFATKAAGLMGILLMTLSLCKNMPQVTAILRSVIMINIAIGLFNLIFIKGFDGFHMLFPWKKSDKTKIPEAEKVLHDKRSNIMSILTGM